MGNVSELPSGPSTDVLWVLSRSFGRETQGHSETCPDAAPAFTWLCASGHRCDDRSTFLPVSDYVNSGAQSLSGASEFIFPLIPVCVSLPIRNKHCSHQASGTVHTHSFCLNNLQNGFALSLWVIEFRFTDKYGNFILFIFNLQHKRVQKEKGSQYFLRPLQHVYRLLSIYVGDGAKTDGAI